MQPENVMDSAVRDLLYQLKFGTNLQRNEAIDSAPLVGTKAIPHLARLMAKWSTPGQHRGAQEAIRRISLHAYRDRGEGLAVTAELVKLLNSDQLEKIRREALYLLGLSDGGESVPAIAALLSDSALREDARMTLERIPARDAETALRSSMRDADRGWRNALDYSLRRRKSSFKEVGTRR